MGGKDVEARVVELAERVWSGLEARNELVQLLREHRDDPDLGPTKVSDLTDYLWRPEHASRLAHGPEPKPLKRRRRVVVKD
jgi:hypothetical protein